MIDTIMFDLDGTLLPIRQEEFTKIYFRALAEKIATFGYSEKELVNAVWKGTNSMQANTGDKINHQLFWETFASVLGEKAASMEKICDSFYQNEFNKVNDILHINVNHKHLIDTLKDRGYMLVLASNPVFPFVAFQTRLSWIGLSTADFSYITHYQNSHYCKPNLGYYEEIFKNIKKKPSQCLMVGNNIAEDSCVSQLGAQIYLVTDFLEGEEPFDQMPHGSMAELTEYLLS
jgi:FMN phosphatase YigB (HAD superfamily)